MDLNTISSSQVVSDRRRAFECSPVREAEDETLSPSPTKAKQHHRSVSLSRHESAFLLEDHEVEKRRTVFENSSTSDSINSPIGTPERSALRQRKQSERRPSLEHSNGGHSQSKSGEKTNQPFNTFGSSSHMVMAMQQQQQQQQPLIEVPSADETDSISMSHGGMSRAFSRSGDAADDVISNSKKIMGVRRPSLTSMMTFSGSVDEVSGKRTVVRKPSLTTMLSYSASMDAKDAAVGADGVLLSDAATAEGGTASSNTFDVGSAHTFYEEEREAFASHINLILADQYDSNGDDDDNNNNNSHTNNNKNNASDSGDCGNPALGTDTNTTSGGGVLSDHLPLLPNSMDLFEKTGDGLVLCHLINATVGNPVIAEHSLNRKKNMNIFQKTENLNKALAGAKMIGCQIVNIGAQDILKGNPILILGIVWQVIKMQLLSTISLENFPLLIVLKLPTETLQTFSKLSAETLLLRWLNYMLRKAAAAAGCTNESDVHTPFASPMGSPSPLTPPTPAPATAAALAGNNNTPTGAGTTGSSIDSTRSPKKLRVVRDFSEDLRDSAVYSTVLHFMNPEQCPLIDLEDFSVSKAELVIAHARSIGAKVFVSPKDICDGNKRLNSSLVAQLFHTKNCLELGTQAMKEDYVSVLYFMNRSDDAKEFLRSEHKKKYETRKLQRLNSKSRSMRNIPSQQEGDDLVLNDDSGGFEEVRGVEEYPDSPPLTPMKAAAVAAQEVEVVYKEKLLTSEAQIETLKKQLAEQAIKIASLTNGQQQQNQQRQQYDASWTTSTGSTHSTTETEDLSESNLSKQVWAKEHLNKQQQQQQQHLQQLLSAKDEEIAELRGVLVAREIQHAVDQNTISQLSQQLADTKVEMLTRIADMEEQMENDKAESKQMIESLETIVVRAAHWMNADDD